MSFTGATALHAELQSTRSLLREQVHTVAAEIDANLWVEKMTLDTGEVLALHAAPAELGEVDAHDLFAMLDQAPADPEFLSVLANDFAVFLSITDPPGEDSLHAAGCSATHRHGRWPIFKCCQQARICNPL